MEIYIYIKYKLFNREATGENNLFIFDVTSVKFL